MSSKLLHFHRAADEKETLIESCIPGKENKYARN